MRRSRYQHSEKGLDPLFLRDIAMRKAWNDACRTVLIDMGVYEPRISLRVQAARFLSDGSHAKAVLFLAQRNALAAGFDEFDLACIEEDHKRAAEW